MSLFDQTDESEGLGPLACRLRPDCLESFVGQSHLIGPGGPLRRMIDEDHLVSMVFWGPPGTGKTTLAKIIAGRSQAEFIPFSAVISGIKEIKGVMERAASFFKAQGRRTLLFIDELHRFNRAQQDAFLPMVEDGSIILLGATTENPSFAINASLLSRCRVYRFNQLEPEEIRRIVERALIHPDSGLGQLNVSISEDAMRRLIAFCDGDARRGLNALEAACRHVDTAGGNPVIDPALLDSIWQDKTLRYDRSGDEHYDIISAFHKSIRNSDPDAALYWLARMINAGEDPVFIARRLVRIASEDVGLADPRGLTLSVAAMTTVQLLGMPEADCALAEAALFLAVAPKSNAVYAALSKASADVAQLPSQPVPLHLRNAPTRLMKQMGHAEGYVYAHDAQDGVADMACLPERLVGRRYYRPGKAGFEKTVAQWLDNWEKARARAAQRGEKGSKGT